MKLRVLVINLNNKDYTRNCINLLLKQTFTDFKITLFDQNSSEEGTKEMLDHFEGMNVDVVRSENNLPVNQVWNWFYKNHKEEILCFLNNDVLFYDNFISQTIEVFEKELYVGIVVHSTNHENYNNKKDFLEYTVVEPRKFMQGWDFSIRRPLFTLIPEELKTYCGDDFLFDNLYKKGFNLAYITSSPMIHFEGKSKPHMIHGGYIDTINYVNMGYPHYLKINDTYSKIKPSEIFVKHDD